MSTKGTDVASVIAKGVLGAIPFVGPLAAEIVGSIIPNQRIDRIESMLKLLESKISADERKKIEERIVSNESVDLIEDGFIQASRSLSEERKDYIASLLKNSLTDDELNYIEYKRLLSILGELNDLEIIILKSHETLPGQPGYEDFWKTHKSTLTPPVVHMGSVQEDIDKHAIYQTHTLHLVNLGLLKARYKKPKRGEQPEFDDKTGMMKTQGYFATNLGRLLLRSIDQSDEQSS